MPTCPITRDTCRLGQGQLGWELSLLGPLTVGCFQGPAPPAMPRLTSQLQRQHIVWGSGMRRPGRNDCQSWSSGRKGPEAVAQVGAGWAPSQLDCLMWPGRPSPFVDNGLCGWGPWPVCVLWLSVVDAESWPPAAVEAVVGFVCWNERSEVLVP